MKERSDIVYIQGVITQGELDDLKKIAKTGSTKDAITYAVEKVIQGAQKKGKGGGK